MLIITLDIKFAYIDGLMVIPANGASTAAFTAKKTQGVPIPFLTEHCILKEKV